MLKDLKRSLKATTAGSYEIIVSHKLVDNLSREYNNLAKQAKGEWVMALNDDCEFKTDGWDDIVISRAEEFLKGKKSKILYIRVRDGTPIWGSFPILSKEAVDIMGRFFNEDWYGWGADQELYRVFSTLDPIGGGRVLGVDSVIVEHKSYHYKKRKKDSVNKRVEAMSCEVGGVDEEAVRKLRNVCG